MKRITHSFTGSRPIFTGSPSLVTGGFNLDTVNQRFFEGDVIPAGTLAIRDEATRLVRIVKTATVAAVDSADAKKVTLKVDEFHAPVFAVGDKVAKADAVSGNYEDAVSVTAVDKSATSCVITLSAAITGLAAGDTLEEVVAGTEKNTDGKALAAEIGKADCVTVADIVVGAYETSVDVCADTMQYELYERRVPAIPSSQKDATGRSLAANPHVRLTVSL